MGGCISLVLILHPESAPGHELQKSLKESGIFQILDTISFVLLFTERQSQKGGHLTLLHSRKQYRPMDAYSDGHDKPFCTKAITIIDYFKNALGDTDN